MFNQIKINGKSILISIACFLALVMAVGTLASTERHALPADVFNASKAIITNQKRIAELRPLVDEFNILKEANSQYIGVLSVYGYQFDWATNKPLFKVSQ